MIHDMIGGGAPLNFKVVGGTSAPAAPKENTIWVNTDVEITGWVFSQTQPENPVSGMVWAVTDPSSPVKFNALKKNSIELRPYYAKQYISGAWVEKEADIYQGGAWVAANHPVLYIFKSGEGEIVPLQHKSGRNASITSSAEKIVYYTESGGDVGQATTTQSPVALKDYTALKAQVKCTYYPGGHMPCLGFSSALSSSYTKTPDIASVEFTSDGVKRVYSLPIPSDLTEAYVMVGGNHSSEVYNIWLE
jgi:hypothetical protein